MTWWSVAAARIARGEVLALVTVCTVMGSAPREAGAKMLVWPDSGSNGGQDGTIGGGQLEFTLVEQAHKMLASNVAWRFQNYPLGPMLGQCCGGNVGILLERLDQHSVVWLDHIAALEAKGQGYNIVSELGSEAIVRTIVAAEGEGGLTMRYPNAVMTQRLAEGAVIEEHVGSKRSLLLFGAGHVGHALAPIVATLSFRLSWFDPRPELARAGITTIVDLAAAASAAPPGSYFLIFTHSHALDYDLTRAVLARGDFAYCGLIGSATKRARFVKRLLADGIAPATVARLTCPIGAIGLSSKIPQVMAVAIAAELLLAQEAAAKSATRPLRIIHAT